AGATSLSCFVGAGLGAPSAAAVLWAATAPAAPRLSGISFEDLHADSADILVANNTFWENRGEAVRVKTDVLRNSGMQISNNLVLNNHGADMVRYNAKMGQVPEALGDGTPVIQKWSFRSNWRETRPPAEPELRRAWIPPGESDTCLDKIDGVERDANLQNFLCPAKDSSLALRGAGVIDSSLPRYVGALSPRGVEPWDWDRTWRAQSAKPASKK